MITKKSLTIPGPDNIHTFTLKNGVTVLSFSNTNTQTVYLVGILQGGGVQDPPGKTGLAHFTANLLNRGTVSTNFGVFHQLLESAGASLSFSCGTQHAWFRGKSLAEDTGLLFRLASEGLREPAFPDEYVERLRRQLLTGLTMRDQDPSEVASMLLDEHLFPGHPYGQPVDGSIQTLTGISREDILEFHAANYRPEDLTIVISGNISPTEVESLAAQYFAKWKNDGAEDQSIPALPDPTDSILRKHTFIEGKSQTEVILGSYGPARTSPDYTPVYIGNNILGQFGLMGRIGKSVRSKSGLAYTASSSVSAWVDIGTWDFSAGVNPKNMDKAIRLIRDEIRAFIENPVTVEELENTKSHLIGRMPMALESNGGLANAILTMQRFNLGLDYYRNYRQMITRVSAEDILEVSRKYLHPDRLVIASAGPGPDIQ